MKWYVKQLSQLANVSVRTLHHYDQIGLLNPSCREGNRYRLYSEADLLRLQQIIALKFLGFDLTQIKSLLDSDENVLENFAMQRDLLRRKCEALMEACNLLDRISVDYQRNKSMSWQEIIETIEVYQMTYTIEDEWVKEIFNEKELKEYAEFEKEIKANNSQKDKAKFEKDWSQLISDINTNINIDPTSDEGVALGKQCMDLVDSLYGKRYAHLRTKKFKQGYGEGKGIGEHGLTVEVIKFMEASTKAYWRKRIMDILTCIDAEPTSSLVERWNSLMDEMYGTSEERKKALLKIAETDDMTTSAQKSWLKQHIDQ